jgi:indole-3-glycerol phosphate synthase
VSFAAGAVAPAGIARAASPPGAVVSVLSSAEFEGSLGDLREVADAVAVPVMRKDFLVDPYQVLEARAEGASGVLLVLALLDEQLLGEMLDAARRAELFVLLEAFGEEDLERSAAAVEQARSLGVPALVGLNARDLTTLAVDRDRRAARPLPPRAPTVAGGIPALVGRGPRRRARHRLALVGSSLMSAADQARSSRPCSRRGQGSGQGPDAAGFGPFGGRFVPGC